MGAESINLTLTPDEALVLIEFFAGFEESDRLAFAHAAEFIALQRISAQLDRILVEPFDLAYRDLLGAARTRLAAGFEGEYPRPHADAP